MDSLDILQVPTSSPFSSSRDNTSGRSSLPRRINKVVKKKLYKRTTTQTSPSSSTLRRISSSRSSLPYQNRRHKWLKIYPKNRATPSLGNFINRRRSQRSSLSTTRSITSPVVGSARRSLNTNFAPPGQTSNSTGELPYTPQSENYPILIESDDGDDDANPFTPSPIRDSPSYGRGPRQRRASSRARTLLLYPALPSETSTEFKHCQDTLDDTTIDSKLIKKLREGPKAEKSNGKLALLYTAMMEGEYGYVKIGWTEQDIQQRMNGLNSPVRYPRIYNVPDKTPGGQSTFRNCFFAEQIIHLELYNYRRLAITRNQSEWFEIDKEEAHRVCRKWRKWLIQCEPYGENQELTEFWRRRLYHMQKFDAYNAVEHGCLHERWTAFLNPSWWDKTSYKVIITWEKVLQWYTWIRDNSQIIALLIGIILWAWKGFVWFLLWILIVGSFDWAVHNTQGTRQKKSSLSLAERGVATKAF